MQQRSSCFKSEMIRITPLILKPNLYAWLKGASCSLLYVVKTCWQHKPWNRTRVRPYKWRWITWDCTGAYHVVSIPSHAYILFPPPITLLESRHPGWQIAHTWFHVKKHVSRIILMCIYIFPGCSCWQWKGAAEHTALRLSMFHRDPNGPSSFNLAPSPSSAGVKRADLTVWFWTGPQRRIGVGISLLGSADWSHSRLCSGGRWGRVFPVRVFGTRYVLFRELGGRRNGGGGDERRGEEAEDEELPLSRCHYLNLIQG